jgi:hypothetical protein
MTIKRELESIDEREDLTPKEKKLQKYFAKGTVLLKKADELLGVTFEEGDLDITLTEVQLDEKGSLSLRFKAKRAGEDVQIPRNAFPFIIVNPPVGVRDSLGTVHENPDQAIRKLLVSLVNLY